MPKPKAIVTPSRVTFKPQPGAVADALTLQQPIAKVHSLAKETNHAFKVSPPFGIHSLAKLLQRKGFQRVPVGSVAESYRLRHIEGAIAILYRTGSVLCQGTQAGRLVAYLDRIATALAAEAEG